MDRSVRQGIGRVGAALSAPAPLGREALASVPGVLGIIARERASDYADARVPERVGPGPKRPGFGAALGVPGISVIAEVKRASPSRGAIADVDPIRLARSYQDAGAAAISVLTEPRHFEGSLEHLQDVAEAVALPLLRKDFVVHPVQLCEARTSGASAVLLIAAVLGPLLADYVGFARSLGLESLVEVHDEVELMNALRAGARILGVNNRDLRTLEIDLGVAPRILGMARKQGFDGLCVAESGYSDRRELDAIRDLADAVLVGSSLAASGDPAAALTALVGPRREDREP